MVFEAILEMDRNNIGALLVMDADAIVGIISERDYARKVILEDKSSKDMPVSDVMSSEVCCVDKRKKIYRLYGHYVVKMRAPFTCS